MTRPRQIPTLHVEKIDYTQIGGNQAYVVRATSYGRVSPSGLGEFDTEEQATAAMNKLNDHLEHQRAKKEPSRAKIRQQGAD